MEIAIACVMGLGVLWYFILAMMGSGKADNLKGFRWKLFAMCLFWPAILIALAGILIWKALFGRKTESAISRLRGCALHHGPFKSAMR